MKFSSRQDTDLPADQLFDAVSDFPRIERMLARRGVEITDKQPYSLVADFLKAAPHLENQVWETLSYFDGASFAQRARCSGYFSVALSDPTCPPSTVFPAFNAWGGTKEIEVYPYNGHEGGGDVQLWKQLDWLARH